MYRWKPPTGNVYSVTLAPDWRDDELSITVIINKKIISAKAYGYAAGNIVTILKSELHPDFDPNSILKEIL